MDRFRFKLDVVGPKGPEEVVLRDLFEFLFEFEKAVAAFISDDSPGNDPLISLVGIKPGHSSQLTLSARQSANVGVSAVSKAARAGRYDRLPRAVHEHFHAAYLCLRRRNYSLVIHGSPKIGIVRATVGPDNDVAKPKPEKLSGHTAIVGRCMRVGGDTPTVEVRIEGRPKNLHVRVTEEIAKSVAKRLYDEVVLEGNAFWRAEDWHLETMEAIAVTEFKRLPLPVAFERLAKASKGRWEEIDASEYVHRLRESSASESDSSNNNDR